MRWWLIPLVLAFGWFAFTLTPFWALYDLARAVQAHDAGYVDRHVNFRTLRLSIIRQAAAAAQIQGSDPADAEPRERQRLTDAAVALAIPLAETLVTPQTVVDLLDDGWPQSIDLGDRSLPEVGNSAPRLARPGLRVENLGRLIPFYFGSEMRGFRTVVIGVPPEAPRARQFRVRLRLRGWTWRLVDIELTQELRERIAQRLSRAAARAR
ncbi:DUF2939 domain-containing protein [Methylobacterium sp. BTF04]|uniref:DUF2939 domain-containing protein n=1 Tax=Methylobacterium sp. BTF04 TaxID=2708300 RepID=UPI0013D5C8C0|nr:DUF2939 domain-containing protein [Methylobacterium sp. BTF04]NEU12297.1 DUF2939 domain-containing protein [Methylobacterium sp. BTF04]